MIFIKSKLQKKLDEQAQVIEKLRKENKDLKSQLAALAASIETRISAAVQEATAPILAELALKTEILKKTETEIARLNAIINKDSSNSSKPPSQNGFKQIPNNRENSDRPKGGQKGHPGHRLQLPENLEELVENGAVALEFEDHTNGDEEYATRWTMDIMVKAIITEHRFPVGQVPQEMFNEVTYGNGVKALVVALSNDGMLSINRLAEFLNNATQGVLTISEATIEKILTEFADRLDGEYGAIREDLLDGEIICTDDTMSKCSQKPEYDEYGYETILHTAEKKSFKVTIRTYSNSTSTLLTVNPNKDIAGVVRDGILPNFEGNVIHDHEIKFFGYGKADSSCGGHLIRELKGMRDLYNLPWAGDMRALMLEMNAWKNKDLSESRTACDPTVLEIFEQSYDALIIAGKDEVNTMNTDGFGYKELKRMVKRLDEYKDFYLLFMRDYEVPFTNNLAERDFRAGKTKLKVSGCFRSWKGVKNYVKTRSFISTLKKRSMNVLASICLVFKGVPVLY